MRGNIDRDKLNTLWINFQKSCRKGKKSFRPRGSVIPWTIWNNKLWYFFGIDHTFRCICDFGGGYNYKDSTLIKTAFREWSEESLDVFSPFIDNDTDGDAYYFDIYKPRNCHPSPHLVIFIKLKPVYPPFIRELFLEKAMGLPDYIEVIDIISIEKNLLCESIKNIHAEKRFYISKGNNNTYKLWDQLFWRIYSILQTTDIFNDN